MGLAAQKGVELVAQLVVSGTNQGLLATFMMSIFDGSLSTACSARSMSLAWTMPTKLSVSPRHTGMRV
jgi:hypothetical protein